MNDRLARSAVRLLSIEERGRAAIEERDRLMAELALVEAYIARYTLNE